MANSAQLLYVMLALPAMFGMTLVGEGVYKIYRMEHGWSSVFLGGVFLCVVAAGYFYLRDLV